MKKLNAAEMEELLEMFDPLRDPQHQYQEASPTCTLEEVLGTSSLESVQAENLADEGILISFDDDVQPLMKDAPALKKKEASAIDCNPAVRHVGTSGGTPIKLGFKRDDNPLVKLRKEVASQVIYIITPGGTKIGMPLRQLLQEFWVKWKKSVEDYAKELGYNTVVQLLESMPEVKVMQLCSGEYRVFVVRNEINQYLFDVIDRTDPRRFYPQQRQQQNTHRWFTVKHQSAPDQQQRASSLPPPQLRVSSSPRPQSSRSLCIPTPDAVPSKKLYGDGYDGYDGFKDSGGSHRLGFQRRGFNNCRW